MTLHDSAPPCFNTAAAIVIVLCAAAPTSGQESRESEIAAKQAQKAEDLKPYVPAKAERIIADLRREAIEEPSGFFPYLDSPYRGWRLHVGGRLSPILRRRLFLGCERRLLDQELQAA